MNCKGTSSRRRYTPSASDTRETRVWGTRITAPTTESTDWLTMVCVIIPLLSFCIVTLWCLFLPCIGNAFATGFMIHRSIGISQASFLIFWNNVVMFSTKLWKNQGNNRGIFTNYQWCSVAFFATFCYPCIIKQHKKAARVPFLKNYAKYRRISCRATASESCRMKLRADAIGSLACTPVHACFARIGTPRNS